MKYLVLILFSIFSAQASLAFDEYQQQWESKKEEYLSQIKTPKCDGKDVSKCEFVSARFYLERPELIKAVCNGKKDRKCADKLLEVLYSRYQLEYPRANFQKAKLWCNANPVSCNFSQWQGLAMYEMQLIESHNASVKSESDAELASLQSQEDIVQLQKRKDRLSVLSHAFNTKNTTINCDSYDYGAAGISTTCH